jgi:hypothetical protein
MKKLMTLALGVTLTFGTVAAVSGQETPKKETSKGPKKGEKGGKKSKKGNSGSTTPPPKD